MAYLTRWDPFRDMLSMRDSMDRMLENFFETEPGSQRQLSNWGLPVDVTESENDFTVTASIPGVNPDDLDITFTDHTLTIKGEVKSEQNFEKTHYHLRERRYGRFERSIYLPTEVNAEQIEASYNAGILTLRLPKTEEVKPRRINIKTDNGQKVLEGSFKQQKN